MARWVVLGLSQDGACTNLFENFRENSLKGDLSNDTTVTPPLLSLVNSFKEQLSSLIHVCAKFFLVFFDGLECVGHSFAYVAHFVFGGDVWIRTQRAAVASRSATNLATHLLVT